MAKSVITPELIGSMMNYLASDSLMGRNTPSPGLDKAADYIAGQFDIMGLKPLQNSYFQPLGYCNLKLGNENLLSVSRDDQTTQFSLKTDYIPYDMTGNQEAEAPVVFAGYGITAPEFNYDDYQGIDVKGKLVMILRQEPGQTDSLKKLFNGKESTKYSNLREKVKMAKDHGAAGILVVSGPLNYKSLKPKGFPWPSLSKNLPADALPLIFCSDLEERVPMVHAGESVVKSLLGSIDSLKHIEERIERTMHPSSFEIPGVTVHLKTSVNPVQLGGNNVAGFLEGSDPKLKSEILVMGAHYDHVGWMKEHKADSDYIFNGADDNASGTCGVLAAAKAFTSMKSKPRRSVLFILFAGEELGLLGSSTYVRDPLLPLDLTVAMINLDMIGRNHPDSLLVEGALQNPDLMKIIRKQNRKIGMVVTGSKDKHMTGGSDHYSFYTKDIPDVFFFTGLHRDYHKVSDNPDRIDTEKNARVAQLAFLTAWYIANDKHHYKLIKSDHYDNE